MSELIQIKSAYKDAMAMRPEDLWTTEFIASACLSCKLPREETPLLTTIIAAPGTGKTELMKPYRDIDGLGYKISDFTTNAFLSGSPTASGSMLRDADLKCMCFADLTPLMDKEGYKLKELLSAMRVASDGEYDKQSGARDKKDEILTHTSMISAATEIFYWFMETDTNFGQRFLAIRHCENMDNETRRWITKRALNAHKNPGWKDRLQNQVQSAMLQVRKRLSPSNSWMNMQIPLVDTSEFVDRTISLANILAYTRSAAHREGVVDQKAEMPTRSANQFQMLQRMRATLDGRTSLNEYDYELSRITARGTLTPARLATLKHLFDASIVKKVDRGITISEIMAHTNAQEDLLKNVIAGLLHNKMVETSKSSLGAPLYHLSEFGVDEIMQCGLLKETPLECPL